MAQDPKNYRDPKVTETRQRSSGTSWVWIAAAVVVLLLLLAWVFGWFGTNRVATVPQEGVGIVEPENPLDDAGTAIEGAAEDTGQAIEGAAEETGDAIEGAAEETGEAIDITPEGEAPDLGDDVEVETVPIQPAD
jgi:hypothetical protein